MYRFCPECNLLFPGDYFRQIPWKYVQHSGEAKNVYLARDGQDKNMFPFQYRLPRHKNVGNENTFMPRQPLISKSQKFGGQVNICVPLP